MLMGERVIDEMGSRGRTVRVPSVLLPSQLRSPLLAASIGGHTCS